ncbi:MULTISPECIES: ankyrin repeat domain-containing protein [Campylobacter]|uniref:Ankyrin domain protein n=1 Tax=Campylobacter porcelli TaxID=1660073 RepID=A0A1X9SWY1_9BACT|nr:MULTISPECIES: ankyrin repeat domain-containing protein [unclassified Campylobacter]ARR00639.1 ankyrin domain protein [Campylobacter sp. RM6137]MCR8678468.1 ankyrin repeat domain-containing protein [Campylobacter sp. RM19072]MCR8695820.1 ankyrin repeat domain-containing protein [Campylobacter sp. RM19073]
MITPEEEKRYEELCGYAFNFARNNETNELEKMIDAGLSPNLKNHKGDSLLMLAAYNGSLETTKMLIQKGARVDERNDRGQTPLAGVCFKGNLEMTKLLVENGADIDANNGMGLTPYSFAVMFNRQEIAKYLLSKSKKRGFLKIISLKFLNLIAKFKREKA